MKNSALSAAAAFILGTAAAHSQVIMINFGSSNIPSAQLTNSPYHVENPAFTGATWNNRGATDAAAGGLVYSDGATATGIALDLGSSTSGSTVNFTNQPASSNFLGDRGGIYSLVALRSTIWNGGGPSDDSWIGGRFTGLAAGTYELLVWGFNGNNTVNPMILPMTIYASASNTAAGTFNFAASATAAISNSANTGWVAGVSYNKLTVNIAAGDSLLFAIDGFDAADVNANRGFLSGLQLAVIPEPSSVILLFLGCATLLTVRPHKR